MKRTGRPTQPASLRTVVQVHVFLHHTGSPRAPIASSNLFKKTVCRFRRTSSWQISSATSQLDVCGGACISFTRAEASVEISNYPTQGLVHVPCLHCSLRCPSEGGLYTAGRCVVRHRDLCSCILDCASSQQASEPCLSIEVSLLIIAWSLGKTS
jgi:hypothetical protein